MKDESPDSRPPARVPGGIPDGAAGADLEFYRAADAYLADRFRAWPTRATVAGFHAYDDRLEDFSPAGLEATLGLLHDHRKRLAAIDASRLSVGARIDCDLVRNDLEADLFDLVELRQLETDPRFYVEMLGGGLLFLVLLEPGSPRWPERLEALRRRLERFPAYLEAARRNLGRPPRVVTDLVLDLNAGNLDFVRAQLPPLFDRAAALRPALERATATAAAALESFQEWLRFDLLPASTGDWRLGRERWRRRLRLTLQSDMPPEEIVRRAEGAIAALRRRMLELAEPLHARIHPGHRHPENGDGRTQAIVGEVLDAIGRAHPPRNGLFEEVRRAVDRARSFIRSRSLVALPPDDDNFILEPTPGFLDGVAVAFFNPPPTLEPDLKKSFWISSLPRGGSPEADRDLQASYLREYNVYALQGLTIHEAFPGHYVQYHHALRSPMATLYKKYFASGTFAEGWAVLAERMMFEAGYAEGEPENLLIHLKQSLRAPINAILDARLHTEPLPEDEADRFAMDLMTRVGFQEEAEARGKLRRAKVSSAQLSTYFVGFTELSDILEEERRRLGPAFDLRAFNERLLALGSIPPRHVRSLLRDGWSARTP
jgi:uncharacterized protein (DUF885 family)